MKIYTKKGDDGTTTLLGSERISKDDVRIEVNGEIDELNAVLGIARASVSDEALKTRIEEIQSILMQIMAVVAGGDEEESRFKIVSMTKDMENDIDAQQVDQRFSFVLPGDSLPSAYLHLARTKARTAERRLWAMQRWYPTDKRIMAFMNRLSDWLFSAAEQGR